MDIYGIAFVLAVTVGVLGLVYARKTPKVGILVFIMALLGIFLLIYAYIMEYGLLS